MITSASNPRLKLVRKLASGRQRAKLGLFVCEGEDLVAAGLAAGITPVEAFVGAERPAELEGLEGAEEVEQSLLAELSSLAHPPRIVAVFRRADLPRGARRSHGAGPLARGGSGQCRHARPDRRRTRAGIRRALARVCGPDVAEGVTGLDGRDLPGPHRELRRRPAPVDRARPRGGTALAEAEFGERVTFVLGAEREGLPKDVASSCDLLASIPLDEGADSLNVAAAGAIALYERTRR